jgi:hypothetical protein
LAAKSLDVSLGSAAFFPLFFFAIEVDDMIGGLRRSQVHVWVGWFTDVSGSCAGRDVGGRRRKFKRDVESQSRVLRKDYRALGY